MFSDSRTPVPHDYSAPGSPVCYGRPVSEGSASAWQGRTPVDPAEPTESRNGGTRPLLHVFPSWNPSCPWRP